MKRLNPDTGKPFTCGTVRDVDPKGKGRTIFRGYQTKIAKNNFFYEIWETPAKFFKGESQRKVVSKNHSVNPLGRAKRMIINSRNSAKKRHIVFGITLTDVLPAVERGYCELTGIKFDLTPHPEKNHNPFAPSIDRIDSKKGYTKNNIRIVLWFVNCAVGEGSDEEALPLLKIMVEAIEKNVKQKSTTPVPTGTHRESEIYPELGSFSATGCGEKCDNLDNHSGAVCWEDFDHRAQASSGNSVGPGSQEVEPSVTLTRIENHGDTEPEIIRLDFGGRHIPD